jgi:hypothetical protein
MPERVPRYQIFVSSTFRDLRKERQAVLDAVLELNHFPSGMEVFPAADATPWEFIKMIIDESDYYVLIIGGVYGSTDEHGISYTEREYDLAVSLNIPVLAFLHKFPDTIPVGMCEIDAAARDKLAAFRSKVEAHHCKYWASDAELKAQVVVGITHAIRVSPRIGWIRGDSADTAATLKRLSNALEDNAELKREIVQLRESIGARTGIGGDLASGKDTTKMGFKSIPHKDWDVEFSWDQLFEILGPLMLGETSEWDLYYALGNELAAQSGKCPKDPNEIHQAIAGAKLNHDDFYKAIYQFMALDYLEPSTLVKQGMRFNEPHTEHISGFRITKRGAQYLGRLRAIKK